RFSVPRRASVRLTLETQGFRGVLSVRRTCADDSTEVKCAEASDDGARASVLMTLDPGTYYAVVDGSGSGSEGAFALRVEEDSQRSTEESRGQQPKHTR